MSEAEVQNLPDGTRATRPGADQLWRTKSPRGTDAFQFCEDQNRFVRDLVKEWNEP